MAEPMIKGQVRTPLGRLTFGIIFGYGCMMLGLMTPAILLLTFKMIEVDPNGYTASYGLVAGVGAFFALIGNPLGGAISDRTNISFGRRRTWIFLGPLVGCAALLWVGMATEIWQILIGWAIAQLFFNFGMAAYTALIPDQVMEERQGTISGMVGLVLPAAVCIGMVLMMLMNSASSDMKWMVIAIIGIAGPVVSLFVIRDGKVEIVKTGQQKLSVGEKISKIYPSPRKFPEFTWALVSKFLLMMGYCSTLYLTVMLVNRMGYTESQATNSVGTLNIVCLLASAVTSILGGILSDKFKKQKPFLYGSAFIMVLGILLFGFVPQYTAFIVASAIIGLGFGCFSAVDMALVARILPRKEDAAKDFGLMNVANALPQSIVPAIAPLLLGIGGWTFFYIVLALCVVLGMVAVKPLPEIGQKNKDISLPRTGGLSHE
ncbi:MFS transporter [Paenibacillus thiaminolyticus]|uniref:MFS transporter n=1 Tax=Paenibacillus thiaminolyticus TaxID=49283 RepID=A0AAP9DQU7_PANTH|nr:MFS transporter [Paenibacillus thiaminolyticus]MCY9537304.1 MFS transporter [Paenibacillus thiaminolyticus]MCY9603652.1 MFS transporter [Paenibacillus thiaminolyticus]MCY9606736.1 MFS transporter [Paenibacillus thiaminolyticus]MCY9612814.1 MFS transporter [Paenibacillus thiaminolyticus]MCY9619696.1 MFS transporter [Paenibacillus thiaminolyticus]